MRNKLDLEDTIVAIVLAILCVALLTIVGASVYDTYSRCKSREIRDVYYIERAKVETIEQYK